MKRGQGTEQGYSLLELAVALAALAVLGLICSQVWISLAQSLEDQATAREWEESAQEFSTWVELCFGSAYRDFLGQEPNWFEFLGTPLRDDGYQRVYAFSLRVGLFHSEDSIREEWIHFKQLPDGHWEVSPWPWENRDKRRSRISFRVDLKFRANGWEEALSPWTVVRPAVLDLRLEPRQEKHRELGLSSTFFFLYPSLPPVKHTL